MMAVIVDTVDGGRGLIRDWSLLAGAEQALRDGGAARLARYYQACIEDPGPRAAWIKASSRRMARRRSSPSTGDS